MDISNSKKIGSILAYVRVGHELCEEGEKSLVKIYSREVHDGLCDSLDQWLVEIEQQCDETAFSAAKDSTESLQKSMKAFISNSWNDSEKVKEWLGLYLGGAIIAWSSVKGVARQKQDTELLNLADEAIEILHDLFRMAREVAEG